MAVKQQTSVIIEESNKADLEDFIRRDAGRTKKPNVAFVIAAAAEAEKALEDAGVAKSHRPGCEYSFRQPGPWASSYGYKKAVVSFRLRRKKDGWVIVTAMGEQVYPKSPEIDRVELTEAARDAVVRAALAPFGLLPPKKPSPAAIAA